MPRGWGSGVGGGKRDKKQPSKPKHNIKSNDSAKAKTIYYVEIK